MKVSRAFVPWLVVTLAALMFVGSAVSLQQMRPILADARVSTETQSERTIDVPVYFDDQSGMFDVTMSLTTRWFIPRWFSITPDDCLEALRINAVDVPLPESVCLDGHGVPVVIGPYLLPGANVVEFRINNFGGYIGVSIAPWFGDLLVLAHLLLMVLCAVAVMWSLSSFGILRSKMVLCFILVGSFGLRLALSQTPGYGFDVNTNQGWAKSATLLGVARSYEEQLDGTMMPNYPPFSMLMFGAVGQVYRTIYSPEFDRFDPLFRTFIKLPAMLADLATAVVLYVFLKRKRNVRVATIAAAVYALHPAVLYNSAVWGQVDSVYTLFVVGALVAALTGWSLLFGSLVALAVLTKMQAVILFPALLFLALRDTRTFMRAAIGGVITSCVVLLPFILGGSMDDILGVYTHSVGYYPSLSYGAFNIWRALFGSTDVKDTALLFGVISYRNVGMILFGVLPLALSHRHWKAMLYPVKAFPFAVMPMIVTAISAYAFFLFNTEMHERYLFPLMALGIPLLFVSRITAVTYVLASCLFLLNLLGVLRFSPVDAALFEAFPFLEEAIGAWHVAVFCTLFAVLYSLETKKLPKSSS